MMWMLKYQCPLDLVLYMLQDIHFTRCYTYLLRHNTYYNTDHLLPKTLLSGFHIPCTRVPGHASTRQHVVAWIIESTRSECPQINVRVSLEATSGVIWIIALCDWWALPGSRYGLQAGHLAFITHGFLSNLLFNGGNFFCVCWLCWIDDISVYCRWIGIVLNNLNQLKIREGKILADV
jgi:hypothetical protein